jgi:hypothetical protein
MIQNALNGHQQVVQKLQQISQVCSQMESMTHQMNFSNMNIQSAYQTQMPSSFGWQSGIGQSATSHNPQFSAQQLSGGFSGNAAGSSYGMSATQSSIGQSATAHNPQFSAQQLSGGFSGSAAGSSYSSGSSAQSGIGQSATAHNPQFSAQQLS